MKLGVFGGTFDPIHIGHLHLAHRTQRLFGLSQIHFVVATSPPHKSPDQLIPLSHRYSMVCLATSGSATFVPSLLELESPASPFSIHTLRKLDQRYRRKRAELYFIAGGDSLLDVGSWRESQELLTSYNFIFVSRPGIEMVDVAAALPRRATFRVHDLRGLGSRQIRRQLQSEGKARDMGIYLIDVDALDISSSQIRTLVSLGKRIHHLVPSSVHEYIHKLHLYGSDDQRTADCP